MRKANVRKRSQLSPSKPLAEWEKMRRKVEQEATERTENRASGCLFLCFLCSLLFLFYELIMSLHMPESVITA